jgi:deazaflavin-dependent oxidoreductase (nitroreductase family)
MPVGGEYVPSPSDWVREQVTEYEASGGTRANTLRDTGLPIIILTARGHKTGKVRKWALMRIEHEGEYALVGSRGGRPENPQWVYNLRANPTGVMIQDGPAPFDVEVRKVSGAERGEWFERAKNTYSGFAKYEEALRGIREIPVFVAKKKD